MLLESPTPSTSTTTIRRQAGCYRRWPGKIVRSLVFRCERSFLMVLSPGPRQISWPKLRRHLGISRVTTATAEEVLQVTGYPPGAVSPLGLPAPLRILADRSLAEEQTVSIGAGIRNAGVVLRVDDLVRIVQPEIGDFMEGPSLIANR
jgi:prolyl-tRNA editing enzyme YbaK/EbsC (Cys-tRNA(Pro) deacylase)